METTSKDVRIYTGYILIENRGRRSVRRFDQLTPSSEARLRCIARKLRPALAKKRRPTKTSREPRPYQSKRKRPAAVVLQQSTYAAMGELVDRVNGKKPEPYFLPGYTIPREAFGGFSD